MTAFYVVKYTRPGAELTEEEAQRAEAVLESLLRSRCETGVEVKVTRVNVFKTLEALLPRIEP